MQIELHLGGHHVQFSADKGGKHTSSWEREAFPDIYFWGKCLVSKKDVEETEPRQWESILWIHLIVHAVVHFLGLLVVIVLFLTLFVKNTFCLLRPYSHTCCCLMAWGFFKDKSRFSNGIGRLDLQTLYLSVKRFSFLNLRTSLFSPKQQNHRTRTQKNAWLCIHLTSQHNRCNQSVGLVGLRRQRSHSLRFSVLASLQFLSRGFNRSSPTVEGHIEWGCFILCCLLGL